METVIDSETGEAVVINDVSNLDFEVYAEIGQEYQTQKQQTREELIAIASGLDPADPLRKIVMMKSLELMDGISLDDVRAYIRKQLLIMGIKEPETEEDQAMLQQEQEKGQQPDPSMVLAEAEGMKAQADVMREKRGMVKDKADIINKRTEIQIDAFNAKTNRSKVMIEAQDKGVSIQNKTIEAEGKHLDNQKKEFELEEMGFDRDLQNMDTDSLVEMMGQ